MQDEELDKIINDAASQHHPAYDDEAWGKMQVLLDKHMPQKKDRRRPFIFWLIFLLLSGAAVTYVVHQNSNAHKHLVVQNKPTVYNANTATEYINKGSTPADGNTTPSKLNTTTSKNNTAAVSITPAATNNAAIAQPAAGNTAVINTYKGKTVLNKKGRSTIKIKKPAIFTDDTYDVVAEEKKFASKTKATVRAATAVDDEEKITSEAPVKVTDITADANKDTGADTASIKTTAQQKDTVAVKPEAVALTSPAQKQYHSKKFKNNFMLTVSAGVDKSFIKASNPGKTKTIYGIGAGYAINKRLRVNTGFYASKKVYDALPNQYKFPYGTQYPNLWMINADCMVYEIPVNFYYSFVQGKKHSWFAGGGLASVLMKEERYNYKYKTPTGQYYNYEHLYKSENKHLFSVITLSGGYQYNISNRVQFMAEPYFKIPLSGIGAGAINLKSGGILFTAAVKPFAKKQ